MTSSGDFTEPNEERRKTGGVRWIRRIALGLLVLVTTLAVTGLVYQAVATRNDRQEFPPPGQLVAVDGFQMHINCTGEGSPTVILDAAGGNFVAQLGSRAAGDSAIDPRLRLRPGGHGLERTRTCAA